VVAAVKLDHESRSAVEKVGPADKMPCVIMQIGLYLRSGKSIRHQQPAKARFHRRLGWCCQFHEPSQSRRSRTSLEIRHLQSESSSGCHVERDQRIERWPAGTEV